MDLDSLAIKHFPQTLLESGVPAEIQAGLLGALSRMSDALIRNASEKDLSNDNDFSESLNDFFEILGVDYSLGVFENYQQTGFRRRGESEGIACEYKPTNLSVIFSSFEGSSVIDIEKIQKRFLDFIMKGNVVTKEEAELFDLEIPNELTIDENTDDYIIYTIGDKTNNVLGVLSYQPRFKGYLGNKFITSDKGEVRVSDLVNIQLNTKLRLFLERVMDSDTDMLTGLYNRKKAYDILQQGISNELNKYRNDDIPDRKLTLYYIDIDDFKSINDTYGHDVGDIVLQRVSYQLKNVTRNPDFVSRLGGEELLVQGETKDGDGSLFGERLRKRINEIDFSDVMPERPNITVSIGYAKFKNKGETSQTLVNMADTALYLAKKAGKNMAVNIKRLPEMLDKPEFSHLKEDKQFKEYLTTP